MEGKPKGVLSRILLGLCVLLMATAASPINPKYMPDTLRALPVGDYRLSTPDTYPEMTQRKVQEIIKRLHTPAETLSFSQRQTKVQSALRFIQAADKVSGTGFLIDQSGLIVTARHVVRDGKTGRIRLGLRAANPWNRDAIPVRAVFTHPKADLAVVYVPTGLTPGVVLGVEAVLELPRRGQWLQLVGLRPPSLLFIDAGRSIGEYTKIPGQFAISRMIPWGGTSGSPVLDKSGRIRAVLAGFYGSGYAIEDYRGARVVPLRELFGSLSEHPV